MKPLNAPRSPVARQGGMTPLNTPDGGSLNQAGAAELMALKEQQQRAIIRRYTHNTQMNAEGDNSYRGEVSKNLEGATIKFGTGGEWTFDTGIPWKNKKSLAATIAVGDQIGDAWRGIAQILKEEGVADLIDIHNQNSNENIMRELYGDREFGGAAKGGAVLGAIAEPLGMLLPIGKAKSAYTGFMAAAGMGFIYGGSLYVDGDESRLKNASVAAAFMGPMGVLAQKFFNNTVGSEVAKIIEDSTPTMGAKGFAVSELAVEEIVMKGGVKAQRTAAKKAAKKAKTSAAKTNTEMVDELEVRAAVEGGRHKKVSEVKRLFDQVVQPLYDNVRKYSSKVAAKLRDADAIQHRNQKVWTDLTKPWTDFVKKLSPENGAALQKLLTNGGFNKATMTFINQAGGPAAVANAKAAQKVLQEIFTKYRDVGYKVNAINDYFPNSVKDLDGLIKREQGMLDKALAKEQKRQGGRALTANQKSHIAERMFSFDIRYSNTAGGLKQRLKREVSDEEQAFYHDPNTALHYYIHTAAEDLAKRDFFKQFGHKPGKKGLDVNGADLDKSVDNLIDQIKKDVPDLKAQNELVNLLRSRFSADIHKTHRFVQGMKNISYAGTLGNFWSAMTQVGDLVFAMHKYGIAATVRSMLGTKVTSKEALGIEKAMVELNSKQGWTQKLADISFKWSGFDRVDAFGKNVNINASLRVNQALARKNPEKFKAKWQDHFGDETDSVINELTNLKLKKNADLSDNVYLMLWNDLAETQPIGLSEMPKKYLDMPNGRIVYAYKTFAMKQFNYMRNQTLGDKNGFRKAYNLTKFMTMFVMANSSIDVFKSFMAGDALDVEDKIFDNVVGMLGTSKYAVDKSQGLGGIIMEGILPVPITQAAKAADVLTSKSPSEIAEKTTQQLPIAGKLLKEYY